MRRLLMTSKLLAANLEEADPAVYEILQKVRYTLNQDCFPIISIKESSLIRQI